MAQILQFEKTKTIRSHFAIPKDDKSREPQSRSRSRDRCRMRVGAHSCGADRFRGRNNLATQPMPTLLATYEALDRTATCLESIRPIQ